MEWLWYYLIFCSSISLTSCLLWYFPVVREARVAGIENNFTQQPILSTCIYFMVTAVLAPFLVPPLFSKNYEERFLVGLRREILKPD